jgi:hypothetical protein
MSLAYRALVDTQQERLHVHIGELQAELEQAHEQQRRVLHLVQDRDAVVRAQESTIEELLQTRTELHEQQTRMQEMLEASRSQVCCGGKFPLGMLPGRQAHLAIACVRPL